MKGKMKLLLTVIIAFSLSLCTFGCVDTGNTNTGNAAGSAATGSELITPAPTLSPTSSNPDELVPPQVEENDLLSGLANSKKVNRDLSLVEDGKYVYFVGQSRIKGASDISEYIMRCSRDGSNLILLGDNAKYTDLISKTEPDVIYAKPDRLEYISMGRLYVRFVIAFPQIPDESYIDTPDRLYSLNLDGGDLEFEQEYLNPDTPDTASYLEDSASDGTWVYYSVIDQNNVSESKIMREKTDGTGKEDYYIVQAKNLQIRDGWLYFASYSPGEGTISCMNLNDRIKIDIYTYYFREHNIGNINLFGNWIYFVDYAADGHLCRIGTDGTGLSYVSEIPILQYEIFGHTIIYREWELTGEDQFSMKLDDGVSRLYRMDLDGDNIEVINGG